MKACIYARYSSDRQRPESIEDQISSCTEYAERNGYSIVDIYKDAAQSGTSDDREEFQRMIRDSANSEWDAVIVYKLDRFARDRYASAVYKHRLRKNGVSVVSATEYIPDTPEGALLESVLEGTAEFYSRQLAENVRRGMRGNARKCMVNGVRLYGYRTGSDGRYEIDESEARYIREAFKMRADGWRIGTIARELCPKMGVPYKRAYNIFQQAFGNRKYIGVYKWGDVVVPDGMPAIVDAALFQRVELMKGNVRMKSKRANYALAGRIIDQDGKRWHGESAKGGRYFYYSNGKVRVNRDKLDDLVFSAIRDALNDESLKQRLSEGTAKAAREDFSDAGDLGKAKRELDNLLELARRIGVDDALEMKITSARLEVERIEEANRRMEISEAVTAEAVREWLERFVSSKSDRALSAFVHTVQIVHDGEKIQHITVCFTWANKNEPLKQDSRGFVLDESGTPDEKLPNLVVFPWGFVLMVA